MSGPGDFPDGLTVRINRRAKRISLRLNARGEAVLTLPDESLRAEGLRFAATKKGWLEKHRGNQPEGVPFAAGYTIPVRGEPHRIIHNQHGRDPILVEGGVLTVSGSAAATRRLVVNWLANEAGRDFRQAVDWHAAALDLPAPPITLRDPKTRWGSCSSRKTLSLSWRLIMAPPEVLDYVAAHETAHLLEMNHSARFWALVERLSPDFREQERWLKEHGRSLHRYG